MGVGIIGISLNSCTPEEIILHGEISGIVTDALTNQPIQAATVKLIPSNVTTNTGNDGKYLFKSLAPGNYQIQVSKQNYAEGNNSASVTSANITDVDFVLDEIPTVHYSETSLEFGFNLISLSFEISKTGPGEVAYTFTPSKDWITINPRSGNIINEPDKINVTINRTGLTQMFINELIKVKYTYRQYDFQDTINITVKIRNEIVFNPDISYGTVADIEGNVYKTIQVRNEVWMAENLKTTKYNDNNQIPLVTDNLAWKNLKTPGYCWFNNDEEAYKNIYGALYNWYTVNSGKLCPQGWHVPTDAEWHELILQVDPNAVLNATESRIAGDIMRETGTTHWTSPNTNATNSIGFTALPSSFRNDLGGFYGNNIAAHWWSSSMWDENYPSYRYIDRKTEEESRNFNWFWWFKTCGFSVRCLKNR